MTDAEVLTFPLPDQEARDRIARDLETNLLVEAGAGSGKTTALVGRLVALIEEGVATADELAAVTFTRKAAGELRERFQIELETRLRKARLSGDDDVATDRLAQALDEIDRVFVGTIHSFCARLLRERPLDVGLDPAFEELRVEERIGMRRGFWAAFLERLARDSDPRLERLSEAGLAPSMLYGLFDALVENPDVDFPGGDAERPALSEVGAVRTQLDDLVSRAWELMDDLPPSRGWDSLQRKLRQLHFEREITEWTEPADLFGAIATLCKDPPAFNTTLKNWRDRDLARTLKEHINEFGVGDTAAHRLVGRWYAHRYSLALDLCSAAARDFEAHRLRVGKLDFQDLLVLAARLLRENPAVRRQLGRRYRRLLVDEFQDTDPLQAEIILLLSTEPAAESGDAPSGELPPDASDWQSAVPRPGALFVVGDPKQSIYRFRRADIQLYAFVRERFSDFGDVVALSTNFRSRPAIGDLVNEVFEDDAFFPQEATNVQAAFERLETRPPEVDIPCEGVFSYTLTPDLEKRNGVAAADDAARVSSWIRARIDAGEREPGDFLILTRRRQHLDVYARALEARHLPVNVTGAGVGVEEELRELEVVLECMIDPSNPVKVVSALVGLCFGIDYERMVAHRMAGGSFDARRPGNDGDADVRDAIRTLHGWWRRSTAEPADVFIARLASEIGLLPYAAAGELGSLRAGAFLYAMDAIRAAAFSGDTSLPGALDAVRAALDLNEAEAPLEPGRSDAVRLMNLHQAKGLEGTVVVLADPTGSKARRPDMHVTRSEAGGAEGFLRVGEAGRFGSIRVLARPEGWDAYERAESGFEDAEQVRLLYVAVTRAREELVVSTWPDGRGESPWAPLEGWLGEHATRLDIPIVDPEPAVEVEATPDEAESGAKEAASRLKDVADATYRTVTVTELAKSEPTPTPASRAEPGSAGRSHRGYSWGSAVHGALALAAAEPGITALRAGCRDLLVEHQRPLDAHGEPIELAELVGLVQTVHASELWVRARRADRTLVEVHFAAEGTPTPVEEPEAPEETDRAEKERRQLDLFGMETPDPSTDAPPAAEDLVDAGPPTVDPALGGDTVLEGVVDLAFRETGGWVIADYKTDVGDDPAFSGRVEQYRRQVDLYADAWSRLTGEPVKERILFYTAQGRMDSW